MTEQEALAELMTAGAAGVADVTVTPVPCPPSDVHDVITHWTNEAGELLVCPGDLVLRGYRLECVEGIWYDPAENLRVRVEFEGHNTAQFIDPTDLVAVRRYLTEEGCNG